MIKHKFKGICMFSLFLIILISISGLVNAYPTDPEVHQHITEQAFYFFEKHYDDVPDKFKQEMEDNLEYIKRGSELEDEGLNEDEFRLVIDGLYSKAYKMNILNWTEVFQSIVGSEFENTWQELYPEQLEKLNLLNFFVKSATTEEKVFIDAVGLTWEDYNIDDNLRTVENYEVYDDIIVIEEGQTIILNALSQELPLDYSQLKYRWGTSGDWQADSFEYYEVLRGF